MKQSYKQVFEQIYTEEPSRDLARRITARIEHTKAIRVRRKAYAFGALSLAAIVSLVPALQYTSSQATNSGLYEYLSLFATDSNYVLSNLKTTLLTILESMPMMATALTLAILLIATYAFKKSRLYIYTSHALQKA
jgi:hypothetical protein